MRIRRDCRGWTRGLLAIASLVCLPIPAEAQRILGVRPVAAPTAGEIGQQGASTRDAESIATPAADPIASGGAEKSAWWGPLLGKQLRVSDRALAVSLNQLLVSTLRHSASLQVVTELPEIRKTEVVEASAEFDWTRYVDSRWDDLSDPVGNALTTGGPARFRDHYFTNTFGGRRKNLLGGQFDLGQQLGHQNNNSRFFTPNNQGTTRLTLNYTQPLLRGAGRVYNSGLVVLANIDHGIAVDELAAQIQETLLQVTRAYWDLCLARGQMLQQLRLTENAEVILAELASRERVDAKQNEILRARAAVEARRADIVKSEFNIRAAEARLRSLVNDPSLGETEASELLPQDRPSTAMALYDAQQSLPIALDCRPEINQSLKQIKSASVRLQMSKQELLPLLNLVLESYVAGLRGQSDIGRAWVDQFRVGEPGYSIGLQYEVPLGNRAAEARLRRRQVELRRLQAKFRETVANLKLEVEVAVYEVAATYRGMLAKRRAMEAAAAQVRYATARWRQLPGEDGSASLQLQDLLDAQMRLADAEAGFLQAQLAYQLAQVTYKKAIGLLIGHSLAGEPVGEDNAPDQERSTGEAPPAELEPLFQP